MTELVLTKLDILTGLNPLRVCTGYMYRGTLITDFPSDSTVLAECVPSYTELPGWQENVGNARGLVELPSAAQAYIGQIETFTGVPVSHVSVGPDRSQIFKVISER